MIVHVADVKYIASCSWGKDSTAMILKLIEKNYPLDDKHIKYTELRPENPFIYDMLVRPKTKRKTKEEAYGNEWCGKCRWHTFIKQKICNQYAGIDNIVYVGIAADEPKRLKNLDSYKRAPLAEWNMTEADCLKYCFSKGIHWHEGEIELYDILDRVSCWCCQNKNLKELRNIYLYLPKYWRMLKGLQSRIDAPMKGKGKSVFQLEERFRRENEVWR